MAIVFGNNATGYLNVAISASDVGLVLQSGEGSLFPAVTGVNYCYLTLYSAAGVYEIVKCTARVGDTMTIVRAQESTTARSFAAGSRVELRVTAQFVRDAITDSVSRGCGPGSQYLLPTGNIVTDTNNLTVALAAGGVIACGPGTFVCSYNLPVVVDNTVIYASPNTVFYFPSVGANRAGFDATGVSGFRIYGFPDIEGPLNGVYVGDECGVRIIGASTSARETGFTIEANIYNFGAYGVYTKFADDINISNVTVHDVGYGGAVILSGNGGVADGFKAYNITPGTASNAYGLSLSHISTNYTGLSNPGTPLATNPFCADWVVKNSRVWDIPLWVGIDAHGAYRTKFINNFVNNCRGGIHLSGSSGDAAGYAGWDNEVSGNVIDVRKKDGTAGTSANLQIGINISGGTTLAHRDVRCVNNQVYGYGVVGNAGDAAAIGALNTDDALVMTNTVQSWGGVGICIDGSDNIQVIGNKGLELADAGETIGIFIRNRTVAATEQTISNNDIQDNGGTVAIEGFRTASTVRPHMAGNNFHKASSNAVVLSGGSGFITGNDGMPLVAYPSLSGGTVTLDLSDVGYGSPIVQVNLSASADTFISDITGLAVGTVIVLYNASAYTLTFTRDNAVLTAAVVYAMTQYDTLVLSYISPTGVKFVQTGGISNNG